MNRRSNNNRSRNGTNRRTNRVQLVRDASYSHPVNRRPVQAHQVTGRQMSVNPDPPSLAKNPWNSATLVFKGETGTRNEYNVITQQTMFEAVSTLLGAVPSTDSVLEYRFVWAKVWLNTPEAFTMQTYYADLTNPHSDALQFVSGSIANFDDTCGKNTYAASGFEWPRAHQLRTHTAASDTVGGNIFVGMRYTGTSTREYVMHCKVLWRTAPFFRSSLRQATVNDTPAPTHAVSQDSCEELVHPTLGAISQEF